MFKPIGALLIFLSVTGICCKRIITYYFTYNYLLEIKNILLLLKSACHTGKNYKSVWESTEFSRFKIYNSKVIESLTDKKSFELVQKIIDSVGIRTRKEELEFLNYSIEEIKSMCNYYKNLFEANRKSSVICGLSLSSIIVIVII